MAEYSDNTKSAIPINYHGGRLMTDGGKPDHLHERYSESSNNPQEKRQPQSGQQLPNGPPSRKGSSDTNGISRRGLLLGGAGLASVAGAGLLLANTEGEQPGSTLTEKTLTPASDGNPATLTLDADPGAVLSLDVTYGDAAAFNLFESESGLSVATGGTGLVYEQTSRVRTEPLPEASTQPTLAVAMHSEDQVDLTVTTVKQSEPVAKPSDPSTALRDEIGAVSRTLDPETTAEDGFRVAGPLWVRLFGQKLQLLSGGATEQTQAALAAAQQTVYGGLLRQRATTWVNKQVEQLASIVAAATVTLVSAKTGLPAGLLEGNLESTLESALDGDSVTWSYSEPDPRSLSPTGGEVALVATADVELNVRGFGVNIEAPIELTGTADGERIPASAAIDDFQVLAGQASAELL